MNEMKEMINFFFDRKVTAHVDTEKGGFFNGLITEVHENFIVINDRMLGETPILLSEIEILERFRG